MSKKTGIREQTVGAIINANRVRKSLEITPEDSLSWRDIDRTNSLKDYPETRKHLLEKRAKGEIPALELFEEA